MYFFNILIYFIILIVLFHIIIIHLGETTNETQIKLKACTCDCPVHYKHKSSGKLSYNKDEEVIYFLIYFRLNQIYYHNICTHYLGT